jgi:hypothetical protein
MSNMEEDDIDTKAETTAEMQDIVNDMAPGVPLFDKVIIVSRYVRGTEYRYYKVKMPEDSELQSDIMSEIRQLYISGPADNTHDDEDDIEDEFQIEDPKGYEHYV